MNSGIIQATLSVVVLGGLSIWCGVCIAEEAEEAKSDDEFPSPLPVYVLPYYHSKGPWVSVGKFSSELKSADSEIYSACRETDDEGLADAHSGAEACDGDPLV